MSMKNCVHQNVRKLREIKGNDKKITMEISLKFGSLDNMKITYSEPEDNLGRSGKGSITSLGPKVKIRPKKYKKTRYAIGNFCIKDISKIIREFEKLSYKRYERRRPKNDPTDSYF